MCLMQSEVAEVDSYNRRSSACLPGARSEAAPAAGFTPLPFDEQVLAAAVEKLVSAFAISTMTWQRLASVGVMD